jgi:hypothetical protein
MPDGGRTAFNGKYGSMKPEGRRRWAIRRRMRLRATGSICEKGAFALTLNLRRCGIALLMNG